jgi:hypothetical protein
MLGFLIFKRGWAIKKNAPSPSISERKAFRIVEEKIRSRLLRNDP